MSNGEEERKKISFDIAADTIEILDARLEYGERSELLRTFLQELAYGGGADAKTPIEMNIERVETKIDEVNDKLKRLRTEKERLEQERERLYQRKKETATKGERLSTALSGVEANLRGGINIDVDHVSIRNIAEDLNMSRKDVHDKLKERNPDVPPHAFEQRLHTDEEWDGLSESEQTLPPEERESKGGSAR